LGISYCHRCFRIRVLPTESELQAMRDRLTKLPGGQTLDRVGAEQQIEVIEAVAELTHPEQLARYQRAARGVSNRARAIRAGGALVRLVLVCYLRTGVWANGA
jgi:hypothetical protein